MRIGIDIDGVMIDIGKFIMDYGTKFCVDKGININLNYCYYDESKTFNWTEEQTEKFWNTCLEFYATKYPARDFASEIIKKLKDDGNEIYIVTARNEYGLTDENYGKMKSFVNQWLKDNGIEYDRIIYTENSKLPYCIGNYIDIMIEDCPEHIKEISTKIPVLCFNCEYNREVEGENITRVYSWYDIYQKINNSNNR